jgi:26S proteasome regulatory subunit N10
MDFMGRGGGDAMAGGAGAGDFEMTGGIDPTLDPELAMAIRVSMEEARAKEEARVKAAQEQVVIHLLCQDAYNPSDLQCSL